MAARLEGAGFDSIWVSDHIVMPAEIRSRYPFAADGRAGWPVDTPWYDAMIALTAAAARTRRVELGVAVLVLPLRQPLIFAKQAASLDMLSRGRLSLGVGAGWLAEEFEALGVPFRQRGSLLEEWVALARACWTGHPPPHSGRHYRLPPDIVCEPRPAHPIPILFGGTSPVALRRAVRLGQGWVAHQPSGAPDPGAVARALELMRPPAGFRVVLRLAGSDLEPVARALPRLRSEGVTDVVVDVDWESREGPLRAHGLLREAAE